MQTVPWFLNHRFFSFRLSRRSFLRYSAVAASASLIGPSLNAFSRLFQKVREDSPRRRDRTVVSGFSQREIQGLTAFTEILVAWPEGAEAVREQVLVCLEEVVLEGREPLAVYKRVVRWLDRAARRECGVCSFARMPAPQRERFLRAYAGDRFVSESLSRKIFFPVRYRAMKDLQEAAAGLLAYFYESPAGLAHLGLTA